MNKSDNKTINDPEIYLQTRHRDQGCKRVALFILALGLEKGTRILRQLSPGEITGVIREISGNTGIPVKEKTKVLAEFGYDQVEGSPFSACGRDAARDLLTAAFGEEEGRRLFPDLL